MQFYFEITRITRPADPIMLIPRYRPQIKFYFHMQNHKIELFKIITTKSCGRRVSSVIDAPKQTEMRVTWNVLRIVCGMHATERISEYHAVQAKFLKSN